MMRLGAQSSTETPQVAAYPYVLAWDRDGRKGQQCKVIKPGTLLVTLEFEDGHRCIINRMAIRRK
jgi:hypothetical protein